MFETPTGLFDAEAYDDVLRALGTTKSIFSICDLTDSQTELLNAFQDSESAANWSLKIQR